ncbi:MAG: chorismate mutase [Candidatus Baltobacteraceae bacterium]
MTALRVRGVRGAITVETDSAEAIAAASQRMLTEMLRRNRIECDDIASVLFSLTPDLKAAFPALSARQIGLHQVPMLHFCEIDVPGSLERVIRVLMHINTALSQHEIEHVYLERAASLRPDLLLPSSAQ